MQMNMLCYFDYFPNCVSLDCLYIIYCYIVYVVKNILQDRGIVATAEFITFQFLYVIFLSPSTPQYAYAA